MRLVVNRVLDCGVFMVCELRGLYKFKGWYEFKRQRPTVDYLIITIVIAALVSPLMVLKPTRRQKHVLNLREEARKRGLQVQVMAESVVDEDGENPTSIRYFVPWLAKDLQQLGSEQWLLVRDRGRGGAPSKWVGWRWFQQEAPQQHQLAIDKMLFDLPDEVNALSVNGQGVGVYCQESVGIDLLGKIDKSIKDIYSYII